MKLTDFSVQEQACHAKCMVLHHLWKKQKDVKNDSHTLPPSVTVVVNLFGICTPLPAYESTIVAARVSQEPLMPNMPRICLPVKATQLCCAEAAKKKRELHTAFKCATIMYDREWQKPDGMSTQIVVNLTRNKTGVELSKQTI